MNITETKKQIYNKFKKIGFPIIIENSSSDYNPVTGISGDSTSIETFAIQTKIDKEGIEGVEISDFKILIPALDNSFNDISISNSDILKKEDGSKIKTYGIEKTAPFGENIMFAVYCRG